MPAPDLILIPYEAFDFGRFAHVGRCADGTQFLGLVAFTDPRRHHTEQVGPDGEVVWRDQTNCLAVLHRFDADGNHLGTDVRRIDGQHESDAPGLARLEVMLAELDDTENGAIRVKPFRVEADGLVHGLVYESETEDGTLYEWVQLEPCDILFHPPWDSGEYST